MQNNKFNIEEEIKKLPSKPGVYLMKIIILYMLVKLFH